MKRDLKNPLSSTFPEPKTTAAQYKAVAQIGQKNRAASNEYFEAQAARKKSNRNTLKTAAATVVGIASKIGYDMYHKGIQDDYDQAYGGSTKPKPYGDKPSNKDLRKWNKEK